MDNKHLINEIKKLEKSYEKEKSSNKEQYLGKKQAIKDIIKLIEETKNEERLIINNISYIRGMYIYFLASVDDKIEAKTILKTIEKENSSTRYFQIQNMNLLDNSLECEAIEVGYYSQLSKQIMPELKGKKLQVVTDKEELSKLKQRMRWC